MLYRGFGAYLFAVGIWVIAMPTLTQTVWLKINEDSHRQMMDMIGVN